MMNAPPRSPLAGFWQQLRKPLELELTHGCPDTAIAGTSIGSYAHLWATRLPDGNNEDAHLVLSLARGLRDYSTMPVAERRRRAVAAIDLLRRREEEGLVAEVPQPTPLPRSPRGKRRAAPAPEKKPPPPDILPTGHELLDMPLGQLAPRARWPHLLANNLHLYTVRDLLYHIPREWVEVSAIDAVDDGARVAVLGTVQWRQCDRIKPKKATFPLYKYTLGIHDGAGEAWIISFSSESDRAKKARWSLNRLPFAEGQRVLVLGKVDRAGKLVQIRMEDVYQMTEQEATALHPGVHLPLYPLTAGVYQSQVHRVIMRVIAALGSGESANALIDPLPVDIRDQFELLPLVEALTELHQPRTALHHELARKRLAFEEFLIPQLILARLRYDDHHDTHAAACVASESMLELVTRMAALTPTAAQRRVMEEIEDDLRAPRAMNRLLQGDVGSGKTLVAAAALAFCIRAGFQAAMMAPTEILAEQLALVLARLLRPLDIVPHLLTGSVTSRERREAQDAFADGRAALAVGTNALIQEGVAFRNLGLVIIDEQHRFGVVQRATLRGKGETPNAMVMTATPIPRTLSLTAFGDLDISVLDELPPGRHPVETRWVDVNGLPETYRFIRGEIAQGRQAYVLCPLVEQSDLLQAEAAVEIAQELQRVFPDLRIGLLHGRLRPDEKDAAMEAFRAGETQILACTTVVEVGVDVPNATVMLIRNAERFGLAQLHQLRGRVGRSQHQSHCLLVTHPRFDPALRDDDDLPARRRLRILVKEQDGFVIAEADLAQRGPGDYLGTRQSGLVDFQIGNLLRDGKYLEQARQAAQALIADDPDLKHPAHAELHQRVQRLKANLDQFRE